MSTGLLELDRPRASGQQVVDPETGRFDRLLGITSTSKKGTVYQPPILDRLVTLLPGRPINIDHIQPGERRSVHDRFGGIDRAWREGDKVWVAGWFDPYHPSFQRICFLANHHPKSVGFSIDSRGSAQNVGGKKIVESIDALLSLDLVANPAATNGLLESRDGQEDFPSALPPEVRRALRSRECADPSDIFQAARLARTIERFTQPVGVEVDPEPLLEDTLEQDDVPRYVPPVSAPLTTRLRRFSIYSRVFNSKFLERRHHVIANDPEIHCPAPPGRRSSLRQRRSYRE